MASNTAADIVKSVGGAGNIESLTHCATRLRFQLVDGSAIDQKVVEAVPGVMGAVPEAGDRYQVVIGGGVQNVYNDIMALPGIGHGGGSPDDAAAIKAAERAKGPRGKFAWLDSLFEFLSDSFRPILGALLGASLFITFMALMSTLGVIPNWADPRTELSPSWQFINLCWQSVFVFLPLMVAYNASKKLNADPWIGFAIMAVVMLPGFAKLKDVAHPVTVFGSEVDIVHIFGVPLTVFNYSSQVFPPLLMAAVLGPLYKYLKKLIPENVQLNMQTLGYDFIQGPMGAWNFACFGATAGVLFLAWRERDAQMKQTAIGALAAGLLGGISEPSLYGIHLRFKRIYPRMLVGCLVGGSIIGIGGGVKTSAFVFTSLLTIPAFSNMALYAVAVTAAFFTAMTLVIISGYKTPEQRAEFEAARVPVADLETAPAGASAGTIAAASATKAVGDAGVTTEIASPLDGTVVPLADVPD